MVLWRSRSLQSNHSALLGCSHQRVNNKQVYGKYCSRAPASNDEWMNEERLSTSAVITFSKGSLRFTVVRLVMSNHHPQSLEVLCRVIYWGFCNDLLVSLTVVREVSLGKSIHSTLLTVTTSHHEIWRTWFEHECVFTQLNGLQFRQVYSVRRRRRNNYRRKS